MHFITAINDADIWGTGNYDHESIFGLPKIIAYKDDAYNELISDDPLVDALDSYNGYIYFVHVKCQ